jgi:hypothetical protein
MYEVHTASANQKIFIADFGTLGSPDWKLQRGVGREWEGSYNSRDQILAAIEEETAA